MKYTIYRYQPAGFAAGWSASESDTIPEGAVSVPVWDYRHADTGLVYAVDTKAGK